MVSRTAAAWARSANCGPRTADATSASSPIGARYRSSLVTPPTSVPATSSPTRTPRWWIGARASAVMPAASIGWPARAQRRAGSTHGPSRARRRIDRRSVLPGRGPVKSMTSYPFVAIGYHMSPGPSAITRANAMSSISVSASANSLAFASMPSDASRREIVATMSARWRPRGPGRPRASARA